jgi:hypothetical protein
MKAGHWIDLTVIIAVSVLTYFDKIPKELLAATLTMIVAARFKPGDDDDKNGKGGGRAGKVAAEIASKGSVATIIIGAGHLGKQLLGK